MIYCKICLAELPNSKRWVDHHMLTEHKIRNGEKTYWYDSKGNRL